MRTSREDWTCAVKERNDVLDSVLEKLEIRAGYVISEVSGICDTYVILYTSEC